MVRLEEFSSEFYDVILFDCALLTSVHYTTDDLRGKMATLLPSLVNRRGSQQIKLEIEPLAALYENISETPTHLVALLNLQHRQDYSTLEKVTDALVGNPIKLSTLYQALNSAFEGNLSPNTPRKPPTPTPSVKSSEIPQFAEIYPLNILIAEDNLVNQTLLKRMLIKLGYAASNIAIVDDGQDALDAFLASNRKSEEISSKPFDLILMDVFMPIMDGITSTLEIRSEKHANTHHRPFIIALTANAMRGDEEKCLQSGMDFYVTKPVTLDALSQAFKIGYQHLHPDETMAEV
eukprot:TRINITY_DN9714_c1_g1_i2.p1 TRINITY_DN9714_c1_g1~~TRINITY_DN9714_c1_g1_i2.p1  ORF type:complete len:292 (-),score=102.78 TRINITY_DN9714_c1_g1_i2:26-901(-)